MPTTCGLDLAWVEKGEVIPDNTAPKSYLHFLSRTTIELSIRIRGPNWGHEKLELADGFRHLFLEWGFPRNKSKIKRKSTTKINNWKKIQPRILLKRTLKKTRNLVNSETFRWNISTKQNKKNTQIQRTLFPGHYLR